LDIKRKERIAREKQPVENEDEILLDEKWLVAFQSTKIDSGKVIFFRQFWAPGFYEAYDTVMTYAEKLRLNILWFKEKRRCGSPYINSNYLQLESFCTYCNRRCDSTDLLPCTNEKCEAQFCSKECYLDHFKIRHHI
jgi:hypothetical protein